MSCVILLNFGDGLPGRIGVPPVLIGESQFERNGEVTKRGQAGRLSYLKNYCSLCVSRAKNIGEVNFNESSSYQSISKHCARKLFIALCLAVAPLPYLAARFILLRCASRLKINSIICLILLSSRLLLT